MARNGIVALGWLVLGSLACGGRTPFEDAAESGFAGALGTGGAGTSVGGSAPGETGGTGGQGQAGAGGGGGTGGSSVGGSSGTAGSGTAGAGGSSVGTGGTGGATDGGGIGTGGGGLAGAGGGVAGAGGSSAGAGGAGGAGGGINTATLLGSIVGRATPACSKCVASSCPVLDSCAADRACGSGLVCALKCGRDSLRCQIGCFSEPTALVTAASSWACVAGTCGSPCGAVGSF
jgi:hypothetical protein